MCHYFSFYRYHSPVALRFVIDRRLWRICHWTCVYGYLHEHSHDLLIRLFLQLEILLQIITVSFTMLSLPMCSRHCNYTMVVFLSRTGHLITCHNMKQPITVEHNFPAPCDCLRKLAPTSQTTDTRLKEIPTCVTSVSHPSANLLCFSFDVALCSFFKDLRDSIGKLH